MALSADDVVQKRFKRALQGYDRSDVDDFLDTVADRLSELEAQVAALQRELTEVRAAPAQAAAPVTPGADRDLLSRALISAQRAADETIAEARAEAERIVAEAQREADATHQRTVAQGEALREQVRHQVDQRREDLRVTLDRVQWAVSELRRTRTEYVGLVRDVLAEQLAALERAGEIPDLPEGLQDLSGLDEDPHIARLLEPDPPLVSDAAADPDATGVLPTIEGPPAGDGADAAPSGEGPADEPGTDPTERDAVRTEQEDDPTGEFPQPGDDTSGAPADAPAQGEAADATPSWARSD